MKHEKSSVAGVAFAAFAVCSLSVPGAVDARPLESVLVPPAVHQLPHRHMLAAKNFCLMHVDKFVKAAKVDEEDYVKLAYLCSHGAFHDVWTLTGGAPHNLAHRGYASVHKWEVEVREAAEHVMKKRVPSERWRERIRKLARKLKK